MSKSISQKSKESLKEMIMERGCIYVHYCKIWIIRLNLLLFSKSGFDAVSVPWGFILERPLSVVYNLRAWNLKLSFNRCHESFSYIYMYYINFCTYCLQQFHIRHDWGSIWIVPDIYITCGSLQPGRQKNSSPKKWFKRAVKIC